MKENETRTLSGRTGHRFHKLRVVNGRSQPRRWICSTAVNASAIRASSSSGLTQPHLIRIKFDSRLSPYSFS